MTPDPSERILELCDAIDAAMKNAIAMEDQATLNRVRGLCIQMKGWDHYINEKASKIELLAATYFSARRHTMHPGGASMLHTEITFDLLNRIRSRVRTRRGANA